MTEEDFFEEIVGLLGGNLVDVELEDTDLRICFKRAKRTFIQKGHNTNRHVFLRMDIEKGVTEYNLPISPVVDTIIKIIKPRSSGFSLEDPFSMALYNDLFTINHGGTSCGGFDLLSYELNLSKLETLRRYGAEDADFHHDRYANKITFFKDPPVDQKWFLDCYTNLSDDEYREILWVQSWTLAEAKEMLGIAYRKFQSLPSPTGETNLSGSEYISEAKQEKEQLLEDILNGVDSGEDFYQIRFG